MMGNAKETPQKSFLDDLGLEKITYWPVFSEITGNVNSGLFLSELVYWHLRVKKRFWKRRSDICGKLTITEYAYQTALDKIRALEIEGLPVVSVEFKPPYRVYYTVHAEQLKKLIRRHLEKKGIQCGEKATPAAEFPIPVPDNQPPAYRKTNTTTNTTNILPTNYQHIDSGDDGFDFNSMPDELRENIKPEQSLRELWKLCRKKPDGTFNSPDNTVKLMREYLKYGFSHSKMNLTGYILSVARKHRTDGPPQVRANVSNKICAICGSSGSKHQTDHRGDKIWLCESCCTGYQIERNSRPGLKIDEYVDLIKAKKQKT